MQKSRPAWAIAAAVGVALIAVGLLVFFVGSFIPSPGAQVITGNFAIAFAVLGAAIAAIGFSMKLLRVRQ